MSLEHLSQNKPTPEERFDTAKEYWQKAVEDGRLKNTQFYRQVFNSPETEIYREFADDDMLYLVATTLNGSWVGVESKNFEKEK